MAFDSLPILRREIYRAGQSYFQYELNKEQQDACLSKFKALDGNGDQKVSQQELRDNCGIMDSSVAARVCRFFELVDGNGNGFLDFDECKALFFLFNKARVCDGCEGLIIHGGLSCLHCLPYHYFDFCCYCVHHQQRHQHYQHRFEALPALINGSSLQEKLPPVMPPPAFLQVRKQSSLHTNSLVLIYLLMIIERYDLYVNLMYIHLTIFSSSSTTTIAMAFNPFHLWLVAILKSSFHPTIKP